jgi:hypothetical protein
MPLADEFVNAIFNLKQSNSFEELVYGVNATARIDFQLELFSSYIEKFNTIDEAMRMLYINGDVPNFKEYKKYIQLMFYFIESVEGYRDSRYLQFLLTIVDDKKQLPEGLKILSWNYDNQLEYAAKEIDIHGEDNTLNEENFFKINAMKASDYVSANNEILKVEDKAKLIADMLTSNVEVIKFAWEKNDSRLHMFRNSKLEEYINNIIDEKENCLVAIGYSFPYVNHLIDRKFLLKIKPKRVYVQNKDISIASALKERFNLDKTEFIPIENCSRFYIPNELYLK